VRSEPHWTDIEGQSITIEVRVADGLEERLPELTCRHRDAPTDLSTRACEGSGNRGQPGFQLEHRALPKLYEGLTLQPALLQPSVLLRPAVPTLQRLTQLLTLCATAQKDVRADRWLLRPDPHVHPGDASPLSLRRVLSLLKTCGLENQPEAQLKEGH
jgi:hypothetical protein